MASGYSTVSTVLGVGVGGGFIVSMSAGSDFGLALGLLGVGVGGLVLLAVLLVFYFSLPASMAKLVVRDRIGDAFEVGTSCGVGISRAYAVPWLWSVPIGVVAAAVAGIVNVFPCVGWIASALLVYYVGLVMAALRATSSADARGLKGRRPATAEATA